MIVAPISNDRLCCEEVPLFEWGKNGHFFSRVFSPAGVCGVAFPLYPDLIHRKEVGRSHRLDLNSSPSIEFFLVFVSWSLIQLSFSGVVEVPVDWC